MNDTRRDPHPEVRLRHLRALAASHPAPRRPARSPRRRHRVLVCLGWVLIVAGPLLALSHLILDAPGAKFIWWTSTLASYDVTVIIVIIGVALALRAGPADAHEAGTSREPSS